MTKISQLTDIGANLAANDEFLIRDVSDGSTPNKKVTSSGFIDYVISQGSVTGFTQIAAGVGPLARALATSSGATGTLTFSTAAATTLIERARIDSSGRLLIGTSTARSNINNVWGASTPRTQIESNVNDNNLGLSLINNSTSGYSPVITLGLSLGSSIGSNTLVSSAFALGAINFTGSDGTNFIQAASISALVDGTPSANDMPGRLVFSTTADGAAGPPTERLRITSTGQVRLAGAGITFNGDTATANELDDYEEGTWTPVYTGLTGSIGATAYAQQAGTYTKIGRQVTATMRVALSSKGSWTGTVVFTGLPFTAANNSQQNMGSIWTDLVTFVNQINARVGPNEATIVPRILTSATNGAYLQTSGVADTSVFYATVTYFI